MHHDATAFYICGKKFAKDKNYWKVRDHCHYTDKYGSPTDSTCYVRFNVSNKIPVAFHNRSNCDYHFIIKELENELENEFKDQSECLRENTEK